MSSSPPVITIDGPSASGKGTIARLIAKRMKWHYLESGALYRVTAFAALQSNISSDNVIALADLAQNLPVKFLSDDMTKIFWSDHDITDEIHTEQYGNLASKIAAIPEVRAALLTRQRFFCTPPGLVTDGRDMGTVVFPEAKLKFFLVADCEERAKRRYMQLKKKGINVSLGSILEELAERDFRDQHRVVSPLKPASDAISIDTTQLNIEQTFEQFMEHVRQIFGTSIVS
ncbi:MAG: (d)CMP kinase [Gammaproteobacteria bacterium]|nr:(d)CMP kinase [Gammaproteobacteria bacterium]